jgi:hypothetical protein
VPYSKITVNVNFTSISSGLSRVLKSAYKYTDSWTDGADFCQPERYGIVDARATYEYLTDHLSDYEKNPHLTNDTMTIPVFAFAFTGETYFTYTYKWYIGKTNWENGALLGIALDQAALVSLNQYEFTYGDHVTPAQPGKGEGFTETIIHETGHEFGLMHPHQYGDIGDFIFSAMGYFTDDYRFGQIDKDAIQRAHIDQLYFAAQRLLQQLPSSSSSQVQMKLMDVDAAYSRADYLGAMQAMLSAYQSAQQLASGAPTSSQTQSQISAAAPVSGVPTLYLVGGVTIGFVAGLAVAVLLMRKKARTEV